MNSKFHYPTQLIRSSPQTSKMPNLSVSLLNGTFSGSRMNTTSGTRGSLLLQTPQEILDEILRLVFLEKIYTTFCSQSFITDNNPRKEPKLANLGVLRVSAILSQSAIKRFYSTSTIRYIVDFDNAFTPRFPPQELANLIQSVDFTVRLPDRFRFAYPADCGPRAMPTPFDQTRSRPQGLPRHGPLPPASQDGSESETHPTVGKPDPKCETTIDMFLDTSIFRKKCCIEFQDIRENYIHGHVIRSRFFQTIKQLTGFQTLIVGIKRAFDQSDSSLDYDRWHDWSHLQAMQSELEPALGPSERDSRHDVTGYRAPYHYVFYLEFHPREYVAKMLADRKCGG